MAALGILLAAGTGERLGLDRAKAFVVLGGRPMLEWSLEALRAVPAIERVVVALPAGKPAPAGTVGVTGGATRSASVRVALDAAGPGDPVVVHDAARPLVTAQQFEDVLNALQTQACDGAIAASAVTDTIKQTGADRRVQHTLAREALWAIQTPQAFRRAALERALAVDEKVLAAATDDAWLVERGGGRVVVVPAPATNLKVTTAVDLRLAEMLLADRA